MKKQIVSASRVPRRTIIKASRDYLLELTDDQLDQLYDIADEYTSSSPILGDWDTEIFDEQKAIAEGMGISLKDAKYLMIQELGFTDDMFE